jgi:hypothetical protein
MCRLSWYLGASTSWNPVGLSRPVMGLLYLYYFFLLLRSKCHMHCVSRYKRTADLWKVLEDSETGTGVQLPHPRKQGEQREVDSKPWPYKNRPAEIHVLSLNTTGDICSHIPTQKWRRSDPSQPWIYLTYQTTTCQNSNEIARARTHTHYMTLGYQDDMCVRPIK